MAGTWPDRAHRLDLQRRHGGQGLLAVAHARVDRLQPGLGVGEVGAELDHDRADGVAALPEPAGLPGVQSDRDHRDQRGLGELAQVGQVGAHRAAAHREHHVVEGRAGGLADRADALRAASPGRRSAATR